MLLIRTQSVTCRKVFVYDGPLPVVESAAFSLETKFHWLAAIDLFIMGGGCQGTGA